MRANRRLERLLGYGLLGLMLIGVVALFSQRGVRADASRLAQALTGGDRAGDLILEVASHEGIQSGLPIYKVTPAGDARPVGHVVDTLTGPLRIRLRPAPGETFDGLTRVQVFAPSTKLSAALRLAVPEAEAKAFARDVAARLERLWMQHVLPDLKERLPAFLERIDPTKDTQARALFEGLGSALLKRAQPILDELMEHVMAAVKKKLDLLDRLGLLWDLIRGDESGIRDALLPTAKEATTKWWTANQTRVLSSLGDGVAAHWPQIRAWVTGELFDATLDELVKPIFEANQPVLEAEAQRLMREAVSRFVEAPSGGFRVRFASLLRHNLLNKKTALLLWLPGDGGG